MASGGEGRDPNPPEALYRCSCLFLLRVRLGSLSIGALGLRVRELAFDGVGRLRSCWKAKAVGFWEVACCRSP